MNDVLTRLAETQKDILGDALDHDPIFFHKSRVQVGSMLYHVGRRAPRTFWRVVAIKTFRGRLGAGKLTNVESVQRLHDLVSVRCETTGERRTMSFAYLSYSAIWRY